MAGVAAVGSKDDITAKLAKSAVGGAFFVTLNRDGVVLSVESDEGDIESVLISGAFGLL